MEEQEPFKERIWNLEQGWTWLDLRIDSWDAPSVRRLINRYPLTEEWLKALPSQDTNYLSVRFPEEGEPIIFGSMPYSVKERIDSEQECERFLFFVGPHELITVNLDDHTRFVMNSRERVSMFAKCRQPIEGLFVLARTILHYFHQGMDQFEINLRKVEEAMKRRNEKYIMDKILNSRFELLYWNNMFTPYLELITAAREAYMDQLNDSVYFQRFFYRAERMETLFAHYEKEINTLIMIDDAVSAFRGNDIMKTLTIITAIFMPATVIGAIWGMNFDFLPWIKQGVRGFAIIMTLLLCSTAGLYVWMRIKGWTGDILRANRRDSNL